MIALPVAMCEGLANHSGGDYNRAVFGTDAGLVGLSQVKFYKAEGQADRQGATRPR